MQNKLIFYLSRLILYNYRNYKSLSLNLENKHVILVGPNGAGKTNILESVSMLFPGKGIRNANYDDISNNQISNSNENGYKWAVSATLNKENESYLIGTSLINKSNQVKRITQLDKKSINNTNLSDYLQLNWFTPQLQYLFSLNNREKLRFIDKLTACLYFAHSDNISKYEHLQSQRLHLLKQSKFDDLWLSSIETKMSELANLIINQRAKLIFSLNDVLLDYKGRFPKANLSMRGIIEDCLDAQESNLRQIYKKHLEEHRKIDAETKQSNFSIKKTRIEIFHENNNEFNYCSTGQQKSMLISIILCYSLLHKKIHGYSPILLLDEITTHLDEANRSFLAEELLEINSQIWMTGTNLEEYQEFIPYSQVISLQDKK